MKIDEKEISYIEFLCNLLPKVLKDFNAEHSDNEYIFSSPSRARFDRLRIELNKSLGKIRKDIYK